MLTFLFLLHFKFEHLETVEGPIGGDFVDRRWSLYGAESLVLSLGEALKGRSLLPFASRACGDVGKRESTAR